jgi:hypothetical protein
MGLVEPSDACFIVDKMAKSPNKKMSQGKNQLYYSTKCRHSTAFLSELKNTNFASEFQLICIDPSPTRPRLPSWLKAVPTLVAIGESTPFVGNQAINWLFERRLGTTSSQIQPKQREMLAPPVYQATVENVPQNTRKAAPDFKIATSTYDKPVVAPTGYAPINVGPQPREKPQFADTNVMNQRPANIGNQTYNTTVTGDGPIGDFKEWSPTENGQKHYSQTYSFLDEKMNVIIDKGFTIMDGGSVGGVAGTNAPNMLAMPAAQGVSKKEMEQNRALEDFMRSRDSGVPRAPQRR